jgi:hypothetical protein
MHVKVLRLRELVRYIGACRGESEVCVRVGLRGGVARGGVRRSAEVYVRMGLREV